MARSGRVLVLSGSAGHGHGKAADAVAAALTERHPTLVVEHWDALQHVSSWFTRIYRTGYLRIVDRHPLVWRRIYEQTDRQVSPVAHGLSLLAGRRLRREVAAWKPDVVLCTHFLAPEVLSRPVASGRLAARLEIVVTDHDAH